MNRRIHRFLLILVALALVASPLRGVFALPLMVAADDATHCAQMQDGMQSPDHMDGMQYSVAGNSDPDHSDPGNLDHGCDQGCGGNCCDEACNACAQGSIALSGPIAVTSDTHNSSLNIAVSYSVSGRTVHPPFRPPIALPG
jgi:uncharacterized protein involved in copper resistance